MEEVKKRGRPQKTLTKKSIVRSFRFTPAEFAILQELAMVYGLNQNGVVISGIMAMYRESISQRAMIPQTDAK
jgi:hypothetical protein